MNWGNEEEFSALEVLVEPLPALDSEERSRLRTVLGPPTTSGLATRTAVADDVIDLRYETTSAPPTAEDRLINISFVLGDIDRKLDKLADTSELIEQLGEQVRRLSERIARIEHVLAAAPAGAVRSF